MISAGPLAQETGLSGVLGWLLGGGLMLLGAGLVKAWDMLRSKRKDSLAEWQTIAERRAIERDDTRRAHEETRNKYLEVRLENQALRGQIILLNKTMDALNAGADAFLLPGSAPVAWIVIDDSDVIVRVGPYVYPIVHYSDAELMGRSVTMLLPEEDHAEHEAIMVAAKDPGRTIDPTQVFPREVLTRQGDRIPVFLRIVKWRETSGPDHGRSFFTLLFWDRTNGHDARVAVKVTVRPIEATRETNS